MNPRSCFRRYNTLRYTDSHEIHARHKRERVPVPFPFPSRPLCSLLIRIRFGDVTRRLIACYARTKNVNRARSRSHSASIRRRQRPPPPSRRDTTETPDACLDFGRRHRGFRFSRRSRVSFRPPVATAKSRRTTVVRDLRSKRTFTDGK